MLLVDDEPDIELLAGEALRDAGHRVTAVKDGAAALELVRARAFDLMICDIRLPKLDGLTLFRQTRQQSPDTTVILMTAFAAVQDAVAAVKEGAHDYLTKPFEIDEITLRVKRIAEHRALLRELETSRAPSWRRTASARSSSGRSVQMLRLLDRVNTIAPSHAPVLLQGESGTGKELVARALHERGARRGKAFVAVNCAAFPETLLEAELFGHERGAFTGAVKKRDGRFRAAHGGTLLLDEVAEMSLPAQAKLLRVLQEGVIEPLGTNESVRVDVRVISATNRNLKERVTEGLFREDLYYRLNVLNVDIPPLRERKGDLPLLVQFFLKKLGKPGGGDAARLAGGLDGAVAVPVSGQRAPAGARHPARGGAGGRRRHRHPAPAPRHRARGRRRAGGLTAAAPAGRGAQGVRARVPAARAGRGGRQAHAGGGDPGHLAQEPVGEAPHARLLRLGQRAPERPACRLSPMARRYSWCAGGPAPSETWISGPSVLGDVSRQRHLAARPQVAEHAEDHHQHEDERRHEHDPVRAGRLGHVHEEQDDQRRLERRDAAAPAAG